MNGDPVGAPVVVATDGTATFDTTLSVPADIDNGSNQITADYQPSGLFAASTGNVDETTYDPTGPCAAGSYEDAGGYCLPADPGYFVPDADSSSETACRSERTTRTTGRRLHPRRSRLLRRRAGTVRGRGVSGRPLQYRHREPAVLPRRRRLLRARRRIVD